MLTKKNGIFSQNFSQKMNLLEILRLHLFVFLQRFWQPATEIRLENEEKQKSGLCWKVSLPPPSTFLQHFSQVCVISEWLGAAIPFHLPDARKIQIARN